MSAEVRDKGQKTSKKAKEDRENSGGASRPVQPHQVELMDVKWQW